MLARTMLLVCAWLVACGARPEAPPAPATPTSAPEPEPTPVVANEPAVEDAGAELESERKPEAASSCPATEHGPHCLWMATTPPNPTRARRVAKRMQADGYEAVADGDRIIVHADDEHLKRLFGGEISHGRVPASSSDRMRCVATVPEGRKLDARYRGEVGALLLDDPTCEL